MAIIVRRAAKPKTLSVIIREAAPSRGRGALLYSGLSERVAPGSHVPKLAKTALAGLLERQGAPAYAPCQPVCATPGAMTPQAICPQARSCR